MQVAPVFPTKALSRFLSALEGRDSLVLLDLGPVVGTNVTFLGERLGCKIIVEDLFGDLDRLTRQGGGEPYSVSRFLQTRLKQADASVDGILCWDLFDYLDRDSARVLAGELTRVLRPGGVLLAFFSTEPQSGLGHTKFEIVDEGQFRHRFCAGAQGRQGVIQNREILQMFAGLSVADSFLLQIRVRELLFRKARRGGA